MMYVQKNKPSNSIKSTKTTNNRVLAGGGINLPGTFFRVKGVSVAAVTAFEVISGVPSPMSPDDGTFMPTNLLN